ncbi:uncharacterized protein LOC132719189 isoform X2 [Ruditapes philippinarum]|uniref:uncharacterized protein LOC132719189 isoform X2 n=1 Tax=Ruditapes philippinarum TaxID=129788 RepID=UPI00295B332A|nr:uncharacterized protein LOC132719189 isoform X2 [Ruditapes philippinarum]
MDGLILSLTLFIAIVWGKRGNNKECKERVSGNKECTSTKTSSTTVSSETLPSVSSTEYSAINPTTTVTESKVVPPMTVTETTERTSVTAPQVPQKESEINAVYIAAPVASCLVVLMVLLLFLWWRHNKCNLSGTLHTLRKREPGALITNKTYKASGIDQHRFMDDIRQSEVNEYAEISLDNMNTDNSMGDDYQEIKETNDDKTDRNKSYAHIKLSDRDFVDTNDTNYSHIDIGKGANSIQFDKTYAQTNAVDASNKPEMSWKDNFKTYNKLNTVILTKNRVQDGEDTDTEYNHAHSGGQDPKYEENNYSHLACEATSKSASQESEESADSNKYEDRNKTSAINITQLSKGTCLDTDYEFTKNNGDLGSSGVSEFAKETHKISDGTTHDYFILAPDPAVDMKSFHVVEDELGKKEHENHEEMNHDYFVLEKTEEN